MTTESPEAFAWRLAYEALKLAYSTGKTDDEQLPRAWYEALSLLDPAVHVPPEARDFFEFLRTVMPNATESGTDGQIRLGAWIRPVDIERIRHALMQVVLGIFRIWRGVSLEEFKSWDTATVRTAVFAEVDMEHLKQWVPTTNQQAN